MKMRLSILLSHVIVAGLVLLALLASSALSVMLQVVIGLATAAGSVAAASYFLGRRFAGGVAQLSSLAQDGIAEQGIASGLIEFDAIANQWCDRLARFEDVEANYRTCEREVDAILSLLDRRRGGETRSTVQLRAVIAGIGNNMNSVLSEIQQNVLEIGRCTEEIVAGAGTQDNVVAKTSDFIGKVTDNIDTARRQANAAQLQINSAQESVASALQLVDELAEGFGRLRACSAASKKQVRALCDPTRQICGIVETIGDVAERTDLLALNASIESIRAGEHGRGFAVVADEIRKLAEQTTQAAREIGVLAESLLAETNDSIEVISREQTQIDTDAALLESMAQHLNKLSQDNSANAERIQQINHAGNSQHQTLQNITATVEKLVDTTKADRTRADHACWAMKSLAKSTLDLDASIKRLRRCSNTADSEGQGSTSTNTMAQVLQSTRATIGHAAATINSASDPVTV